MIINPAHLTTGLGFTTRLDSSFVDSNPREASIDRTIGTGFTTKTAINKPSNGSSARINGGTFFITPLIKLVGRHPDEIYESILRKVDLHHSTNPYSNLQKFLKDNYKLEMVIKRPLPVDIGVVDIPDWFPRGYVEFKGIPESSPAYKKLRDEIFMPIFKLLHADHRRSLIFTPEEIEIVAQLHKEYTQDLNLLGNVIEQALEFYIDLLEVKLGLHGITNVRFQNPEDDPDKTPLGPAEIYYDTLLNPEIKDQQLQIRIPEDRRIVLKLLQEKTLNKALDYVSEILSERFFCENPRLKSDAEYRGMSDRVHLSYRSDLAWDPDIFKPRARVLAAVGIVPPVFLTTYGLPSTNIGGIYNAEMLPKPYSDISIDENSPENIFLRPIHGYLHRLLLLIQENQMGTKTNYRCREENRDFKTSRYFIRNPIN